eukprot:TRINITY_DN4615_c0_g3_i1.p2 TRINITY_DN4615_c0_g3~~TRINITY_DN4615_c0_g3_i1.p2  ORF type:complete len:114 (+),score=16.68 TRINITY_DN4615_c0_g3_i1:32-343(+)
MTGNVGKTDDALVEKHRNAIKQQKERMPNQKELRQQVALSDQRNSDSHSHKHHDCRYAACRLQGTVNIEQTIDELDGEYAQHHLEQPMLTGVAFLGAKNSHHE